MTTPNKEYNAYRDWYERRHRSMQTWNWRVVDMTEPWIEQAIRTLSPLRDTCKDCTMCRLGLERTIGRDGKPVEDQHVFSNMLPSRFMVIGQNPGFDECLQDEPFVGDAGQIFEAELQKYGVSRDEYYISNVVKCYSESNIRPQNDEIEACEPFLKMEVRLMRPILVITLGKVAFEAFCPDIAYSEGLGKISHSAKFNTKVFGIFHPSPLNLKDPIIKAAFEKQVALMCKLKQKLNKEKT